MSDHKARNEKAVNSSTLRQTETDRIGSPKTEEPDAEVDSRGSDQESNVTGRSKPSSDGVSETDDDE